VRSSLPCSSLSPERIGPRHPELLALFAVYIVHCDVVGLEGALL
jgi:hypothetical protein